MDDAALAYSHVKPDRRVGATADSAPSPVPTIETLGERAARPLLSVMIPTYNSAAYLPETLHSVLSQDPGAAEMEIEVVDNCSTHDDPEQMVAEIGGGRIKYHRQATNVGAIENFNTCIRRASGEWVYILHSDDFVRPGFFAAARKAIAENPEADAVAFRIIYMDEDGVWTGLSDAEARRPGMLDGEFVHRQLLDQRIQFVGMIVRRSAYEELGGFRLELKHCADWDMWNRLATHKQIFYEPEPLACYRLHGAAESSRVVRTGENVADERRCIRLSLGYVPGEHAKQLYRQAMKAAAVRASRRMRIHWLHDDYATALRQLREALRCSFAPIILARLLCLCGLMVLERRHRASLHSRVARLQTGLATEKAERPTAARLIDPAGVMVVKAAYVAAYASASLAEGVSPGSENTAEPLTRAAVVHVTQDKPKS